MRLCENTAIFGADYVKNSAIYDADNVKITIFAHVINVSRYGKTTQKKGGQLLDGLEEQPRQKAAYHQRRPADWQDPFHRMVCLAELPERH